MIRTGPSKKIILAHANSISISIWIILLAILLIFIFIYDVNGNGLKNSIYYRGIGILIYPIFYLSIIYGLYEFIRLFYFRNRYLMIDDLNFYIAGKRSLKISSVNNVVISQKNILGIRSLIISGCDSSISIKENFLKEDIEIVKKRIIEFVR